MASRWGRAFLLAAALLAGLALPAAPTSHTAGSSKALEPIAVALAALPGAVDLAILEAQDRLLSSEAQGRLEVVHDYVQGFGSLPAGKEALADPATRAAYTWAEEAVEAALGLPMQLDELEEAGAICRSYGNEGTAEQVGRALDLGPRAEATLAVLRSELHALAARVPAGVDGEPFGRAVARLDAYMSTAAPEIHTCLGTLVSPEAASTVPQLFAVVLPPEAYRTEQVRIVGTVVGAAGVAVSSASLSLSRQAQAENGTFRIPFTVPRAAALGNHTVVVTAGPLRAEANLTVALADVALALRAPTRVAANATFAALLSASSPAGTALVDRVPVQVSWRQANATATLRNGTASRTLSAGAPGEAVLTATFPGDDVLAPAQDAVRVEVFQPGDASAAPPGALGGFPVRWIWWLLVLIGGLAGAILLYMMPVILHRLRGSRGTALRGTPSPPRWPGAATFIAAVAALFDLLRRHRLVPEGATFREWLLRHGGPAALADRFDAVRYGGQTEDEALQRSGLAWAERSLTYWRRR